MAFSSVTFLFGFLPLVLLAYFLCPAQFRKARNGILLAFSLVFYAWGGIQLLPVLLGYSVVNWAAARGMVSYPRSRKWLYGGALTADLLVLGVCKYTGFFLRNLQSLGAAVTLPDILLPAGISFFTFQAIAYLTDVYRGTIPAERCLGRFTLFLSFFPQLLQGPILRYSDFAPALTERRETLSDVSDGAARFCFGLAKKVLLADTLGQAADAVFSAGDELTVTLAWLGAIGYSFQLYFDFSGYTDMALGLGRVFGFVLPENFDYPYLSQSASEFWRRWHRTLSFWFRDYVYIPLGGNRCSTGKQLRNLAVVWMLTGLWHGAAWNFVLWGVYYAVLLAGEKFCWGGTLKRLPGWVRHGYALVLIAVGWTLFRSGSLAQAGQMVAALFGFAPGGWHSGETVYYLRQYAWEWVLAIPACLPVKDWAQNWLKKQPWSGGLLLFGPKLLALGLLGYSVVRLLGSTFRSFLYFQF